MRTMCWHCHKERDVFAVATAPMSCCGKVIRFCVACAPEITEITGRSIAVYTTKFVKMHAVACVGMSAP